MNGLGPARRPITVLLAASAALMLVVPSRADGWVGSQMAEPGATVKVGSIGAVVPPPGTTIWIEGLSLDGAFTVLTIETRRDGTVILHRVDEEHGSSDSNSGGGVLPACHDPAFTPTEYTAPPSFAWRFKRASTPSSISPTAAEAALKRAAGNVVGADNDCDLDDNVAASHRYLGTTSRAPNVSAKSVCLARDGESVVGFGDLASQLALACWWTQSAVVVEADIRLNKADHRWAIYPGKGCMDSFAVEAVATHEFGHVFGLGHVNEDVHGKLTMSPLLKPCQNSESTLGAGDVLGLAEKYPAD
jgi:matrixin